MQAASIDRLQASELHERFHVFCARFGVKSMELSVWRAGDAISTAVVSDGQRASPSVDPMPAGCMAKVLAAHAVFRACEENNVSVVSEVADVLGADVKQMDMSALSGVCIRHLLHHSHGIDSMGLKALPPLPDGTLDFEGLLARCRAVPRLFEPGHYFSYSDIGAILAGVLVEKLTGKLFGQYLEEKVYSELGIPSRLNSSAGSSPNVCPTLGGDLRLTSADLAAMGKYLCEDFKARKSASLLARMRDQPMAFPGHTTFALYSCMGINQYSGGWFGYNSRTWSWRFHPELSVALAVGSQDSRASWVMQQLINSFTSPDTRSIPPALPRPYNDHDAVQPNLPAMAGTYQTHALSATVLENNGRGLLVVDNRSDAVRLVETRIERTFQWAEHNAFHIKPDRIRWLNFGQFVHGNGDRSKYEYLWNGQRLWRRVPES